MNDQTNEPTPEQQEADDLVSRVFILEGAKASLTPFLCNRFQVFQGGSPNLRVVVVGGGGLAQITPLEGEPIASKQPLVSIVGAFAINKDFATDLSIMLEHEFGVTDEYRAERKKRYAKIFAGEPQ